MPELNQQSEEESPANRQAWVYIVQCADRSLYTGWTYDIEARVAKHNTGKGAKYTRARLPVTLRWSEKQANRSAAMKREAAIKKLTSPQKRRLIGPHPPSPPLLRYEGGENPPLL